MTFIGVSTPPGATPTLPFRVLRSKNRNLPVYTDYKSGRNQVLTLVRKIEGNVQVNFSLIEPQAHSQLFNVAR